MPQHEFVDAVAEERQESRQHDHRARRRQGGDGDAGVGERAQEGEREHQQGGEGGAHGEAAEHDRAPCRLHRPHDRRLRCQPVGHLLPVAGNDEQAVVDRQGQAHGGGQVEGEDRDLGEAGDHPQGEEAAQDRQHPEGEGQRGGHPAPEHQDQQHEGDRNCDELCSPQVGLDLGADLPEHLGEAADPHGDDGVVELQGGRELLDAVADLVVVPADPGQHQGLAGVVRAKRGRRPERPVGNRLGDVGGAGEPLGHGSCLGRHRRGVDGAGLGRDQQHQVGGVGVEDTVQLALGPGRGRARVVEAARAQVLGHAAAEGAGDEHEDDDTDQEGDAAADDECGEPSEHEPSPLS